jgi:TatD DNase family protein
MNLIDIHTHNKVQQCSGVLAIQNINPFAIFSTDNPFSVGLHPWKLPIENEEWFLFLVKKIARHDNCLAIGECGLDFSTATDRNLQIHIFTEQIRISEATGLPLIIHCVKAFHEIFSLKKNMNPQSPWIIHGFGKGLETMQQCIDHGFYLSLGKKVNDVRFHEVVRQIPLNVLFAETDDGSASIREIYDAISNVKEISIDRLTSHVKQNFKQCFKQNLYGLEGEN